MSGYPFGFSREWPPSATIQFSGDIVLPAGADFAWSDYARRYTVSSGGSDIQTLTAGHGITTDPDNNRAIVTLRLPLGPARSRDDMVGDQLRRIALDDAKVG